MALIKPYINYIIITGGQWRHLSVECQTNDRYIDRSIATYKMCAGAPSKIRQLLLLKCLDVYNNFANLIYGDIFIMKYFCFITQVDI